MSSTSICSMSPRTTCTESGAPPAPVRAVMLSLWQRRRRAPSWRRSSDSSGSRSLASRSPASRFTPTPRWITRSAGASRHGPSVPAAIAVGLLASARPRRLAVLPPSAQEANRSAARVARSAVAAEVMLREDVSNASAGLESREEELIRPGRKEADVVTLDRYLSVTAGFTHATSRSLTSS